MAGKWCNGTTTPAENVGFAKNLKLMKAYAEGVQAVRDDNAILRTANPHPDQTGEFICWDNAWLDVQIGGDGAQACTAYPGWTL